eukprot:gene16331-19427_t
MELILSKTNIGDEDIKSLTTLSKLRLLKLNNCQNISLEGVESIALLPSLTSLHLNHCPFLQRPNSIASLARAGKLVHLDLSFCFMNDQSMGTAILEMPSLQSLSIRYNHLTPAFLKALASSPTRTQLVALDLRESSFIVAESALCLHPAPRLTGLFISTYNRRSKHSGSGATPSGPIDLAALYRVHNNLQITVKATQLNQSSLRVSILEKQEHFPMILLGEDDKFQATVVKSVIERMCVGCSVTIATNGKSAFEMYCETPFFVLVMMDIFMPILDGLSSIRMIRQFERNTNRKRTPIIICSGNESSLNTNNGEDDGGDAYVSKPFRPSLVDLIMKLTLSSSPQQLLGKGH